MTSADDRKKAALKNRLALIAQLLGCSEESIEQGDPECSKLVETTELLEIWYSIEIKEKRQRILSFARRLVAT